MSVLENVGSVSCGRLNPYVTFIVCDLGVCGSNSVVECDLAKVEVAGSNPVSRSIISFLRSLSSTFKAPSPSGKAEVCKTSIPGSNPGGASIFP